MGIHAPAGGIHALQGGLCCREALLGGEPVQPHGLAIILPDAPAGVILEPQEVLRVCAPLIGSEAEPVRRLAGVPLDAFAVVIHAPQVELRVCVALLGAGAKLFHLRGTDRGASRLRHGVPPQRLHASFPASSAASTTSPTAAPKLAPRPWMPPARFSAHQHAVGSCTGLTLPMRRAPGPCTAHAFRERRSRRTVTAMPPATSSTVTDPPSKD